MDFELVLSLEVAEHVPAELPTSSFNAWPQPLQNILYFQQLGLDKEELDI